jgi:hypothetical protein
VREVDSFGWSRDGRGDWVFGVVGSAGGEVGGVEKVGKRLRKLMVFDKRRQAAALLILGCWLREGVSRSGVLESWEVSVLWI